MGEFGEGMDRPPFLQSILPNEGVLRDGSKGSFAAQLTDANGANRNAVDGGVPFLCGTFFPKFYAGGDRNFSGALAHRALEGSGERAIDGGLYE